MSTIRYPKPATLAALDTACHHVIEASAGTGKTYLIEHLVVDLLLTRQVPLDAILVVTFTEKATAELTMRIRAMLTRLLVEPQESAAPEAPCWLLDDTARQLVQRALQAFGSAPISTMHGFCQRVLSDYAFHHQRLFQHTLMPRDLLAQRVFTMALRDDFARQQPVVLHAWLEAGYSLEELRTLLAECYQKRLPLQPHFDAVALQRCLQQGSALLQPGPDVLERLHQEVKAGKGHGGTKNALLKRLTQIVALFQQSGLSEDILRFLQQYTGEILQDIIESYDKLESRGFQVSEEALLPQVLHYVQALCRLCVPFKAAVVQILLGAMQQRFTEEKQRHGSIDFDDMIHLVWAGLQDTGPHGHALRSALRQRYRYAIIDEFQDTDAVQWQIFRHLFTESPDSHRLFVVADPKQAIYAFRGADVAAYRAARQALASDGPISLNTNYRSTAPLVASLNAIFATDAAAPLLTGNNRSPAEVLCGRPHLRLHDAAAQESPALCLVQLQPGQQSWNAATVRRVLGCWIVGEIRRLLAEPLWLSDPSTTQRLQAGDIFILGRSQADAQEMAEYLREAGVPYVLHTQEGLLQSREAAELYDVLRAVAMPDDRGRCLRAWLTPFFAVPLESLGIYEHVPTAHLLRQRLSEWHALATQRDYAALFSRLLYDSGLMQRALLLEQRPGALANYQHLSEVLLEETSRTQGTLTDLLRTFKAAIEQRQVLPGAEGRRSFLEESQAVQVMTMHKSKGLEAALVFFYGGLSTANARDAYVYHTAQGERVLTLGHDETARKAAQQEHVEEEQRLLYVALSRARARLYLPYMAPEVYDTRWRGCHRLLNDRLSALLQEDRLVAHLVPCNAEMFEATPAPQPIMSLPPDTCWEPPATLLVPEISDKTFRQLRRQHAGAVITSYSRIKQASRGYQISYEEPDDLGSNGLATEVCESSAGELPGGAMMGRFIHALLEEVPLASFATATTPEAWGKQPEILRLFERLMQHYACESRYLLASQKLVYSALASPVTLGPYGTIGRLADCTPFAREMEFVYPIPELHHPPLHLVRTGEWSVERGYIKGYIDAVFTHQGLVYVADWKTDLLPRYAPTILWQHVQTHYHWQVLLYTLALVKMLEIHHAADYDKRCGGLLYGFLRGMQLGGDGTLGVIFQRPSWEEVLVYEDEIKHYSHV